MKHLKRFNEEIGDPRYIKCNNFYREYKNIVDFDESVPSRIDLLDEIGDLCNEFKMSKEDVKFVLDNFDCSFDIDGLLQSTYNEWVDEQGNDNDSLRDLVEDILDTAKLDPDAIDEADPDLIPHIMTMIENWIKKNR